MPDTQHEAWPDEKYYDFVKYLTHAAYRKTGNTEAIITAFCAAAMNIARETGLDDQACIDVIKGMSADNPIVEVIIQ